MTLDEAKKFLAQKRARGRPSREMAEKLVEAKRVVDASASTPVARVGHDEEE